MNKTLKRIISVILVLVIGCGAVWGGLVIYRNTQKKPVNVYMVQDFAMTEYWGDTSQTYGMVTTDKLQDIYISDTQTVKEIFVTEGQEVKVGDEILAYDTTLSDIDLEKADIELQKLKLQMETAEKELQKIINMRPHSTVLITPESSGIEYIPQATPYLISGKGTEEEPFYYLWGEDDIFTIGQLAQMFPVPETEPEAPETPDEPVAPDEPTVPDDPVDIEPPADTPADEPADEPADVPVTADLPDETEPVDPGISEEPQEPEEKPINYNESYVVFIVRQHNALNAAITSYWGLYLNKSSGDLTFRFYEPVLPEEIQDYEMEPEPYYESYGSDYTAAELAQMRNEKEQEIRDLEVSIKLAQVEFDKLDKEVNDGVIRSTVDGTVKVVRDPDEAYQNSEAVVQVSGGGGYYIDVSMSELELGTVEVGQTVTVNSWNTGTECEGTIVEISEYPLLYGDSWSDGNRNVSFYPFRVFVDESQNLIANDYVDVSYQNTVQDGNSLYLENMFIRTDGGRSYVYVRGEDGKLEERTVQTGRSLWGSYTQIRGGLTVEDYVAFPYGKDVESGAATTEATVDDFYSSY